MTDFDGLRCAVTTGNGIIARFPGVVCVAPTTGGQALPLLPALIELCRETAGNAPGRVLARRLSTWLGGLGDAAEGLTFGTVAATGDDGLAVFLLGNMRVLIPELDTEVSGTDAAAWTDRLLARPDAPVVLTAAGVASPLDAATGLYDLRVGVVPGATAVLLHSDAMPLHTGRPPGREPARPEPSTGGPTPAGTARPAELPLPIPARRADAILGVPDDSPRPPLPTGRPGDEHSSLSDSAHPASGAHPASEAHPSPEEPQAQGHLCSRGHLNDPRSHFCVLCGIRMNQRTGVLVLGSRPPLGLLVLDSGATYTVDADYLIGRNPEVDERVRSGALRSITVEDRSGSMSRVHAEIRLDGWDVTVVDSGSSNGTFVKPPGQDWRQLMAQEPARLTPGTQIRLGDPVFVFESPSGVR